MIGYSRKPAGLRLQIFWIQIGEKNLEVAFPLSRRLLPQGGRKRIENSRTMSP